jgi:hypothetical protein
MENDVSANDVADEELLSPRHGFDAASLPGDGTDADADTPDEDWDWLEDLVVGHVEAAGALNASMRGILESARTGTMLASALNTSGIAQALTNLVDTQQVIAASALAAFAPPAGILDSFRPSLALDLTNTIANLPDSTLMGTTLTAAINASGIAQALTNLVDTQQTVLASALAALAPPAGILDSFRPSIAWNFTNAFANLPDSTLMGTTLSAAINASGFTNAYASALGNLFGTARIAATLGSALHTPTLAMTFTALQEQLVSWSSTTQLVGDLGLFTGLGSDLEDRPVPRLVSSNTGLAGGAPAWPGLHEELNAQGLAVPPAQTPSISSVGHVTTNDAANLSWIKRYNDALMLAIGTLALVIAILAWLFPRSTPTPVQVKVVWIIVQSSLGTHGAIAPSLVPGSHVLHQPAGSHGSR